MSESASTHGDVVRCAACALVLLAAPGVAPDAEAQDCGSWSQPILCEAVLVATVDGAGSDRVGGRARLRLAPRGGAELAIDGRDQRGRRFPADRLALDVAETGCGRLLQIENRGRGVLRLNARSDAGRCRLELWVPGNLNFLWQLDVEVDPGARTSYSRREAESIVRMLYRAVLGRDVDEGSARAASAEVQQGHLEALIASMVRSAEFAERRAATSPEELLDQFYEGIFDRTTDTGGVREYLNLMRSGRYADVLIRMIRSAEFERRLPG
ncbi:MAG: DUF4214 domain-containing protein [Acidimicrobiia bacterium]|nr:DUF4214 domain-containing protein [Acidimicrobiia bacterium]